MSNIVFQVDMVKRNLREVYYENLETKKVIVLGGSLRGIEVLKVLQKFFECDIRADVTLVNSQNFVVFVLAGKWFYRYFFY